MEAILNDRYQLIEELGLGGLGVVYRAYDSLLDREVAIKLLSQNEVGKDGHQRLIREAQVAAKLSHPNIVTIYDVGEADNPNLPGFQNLDGLIPYIVMELIDGFNLHEDPPEDFSAIQSVSIQVCEALELAHSNGIIHRDLKPENIIITPDGTAKLMDFGLARSLASRLTKDGLLIGTVFYLAPELAMGQEFDNRADLYALGVMLYELTTGELPFVADDPVAVISQHIHAPVVPPRAKNQKIPLALNNLILRLLSKDPIDRPGSAIVVRQLLEAPELLNQDAIPDGRLSPLDRIVRGRLIGRELELQQARQAWIEAANGQGRLLLVSGDPGIGKTRLMREIVTQAEIGGGQAFIGESRVEGNAPYTAFTQIIRRALREHPNNDLEIPQLILAELMTIAPEIQFDYPDIPSNPPLEPDSERSRLFESVIRFVTILCEKKPLLLVLEDIHWADSGTLALMQFLAQRTRDLPVMLVGTYRQIELDGALPFHETLLNFNRSNLGIRQKLERLDQAKTQDLLSVIFATEISSEFLAKVYKETEGNPFFIEEVCKALVESGEWYFAEGEWRQPDLSAITIPQSIKVVIHARLIKLSKDTQEILLNAAVIGREFDYWILKKITGLDEDTLIDGLEAALKAQLIEERKEPDGDCLLFSHTLIPAVLRESISGLRRTRLHRKVAQEIEESHPEAYQRLAYHWGEGGDEERGLVYTIKAADRARRTYANEDAIRLYSEALALLPEDHKDFFDLLAARSAVYDMVADRESQLEDVKILLKLAEERGDQVQLVDALIALAQLNIEVDVPQAREPAERALEISKKKDDPAREARAYYILGMHAHLLDERHKACQYLENAIVLARAVDLTRDLVEYLSAFSIMGYRTANQDIALNAAQEAQVLSKEISDKRLEMTVNVRMASIYHSPKDSRDALRIIEDALKTAREFGDMDRELNALNIAALILMRLNQFEKAETYFLEIFQTKGLFSSTAAGYAILNFKHLYMQMMAYEKQLFLMADLMDRASQAQKPYWIYLTKAEYALSLCCLGMYHDSLKIGESNWSYVERSFDQRVQAVQLGFLGYFAAVCGNFDLAHGYLEKAQQRIEEIDESNSMADVLFLSANVALFDGKPGAAKKGLELAVRGLEIYENLPNFPRWWNHYIIAGLHLALVEEDLSNLRQSLDHIEQALIIFEVNPSSWLPYEYLFFLASRIYRANDCHKEADDLLRRAFERVMVVAGKIADDDLRRSYLENVSENREILIEAKESGIGL